MTKTIADIPVDLLRRVGVTLAALAVYLAAHRIPLPGIDPAPLASLDSTTSEALARASVAAFGISPLFTALMLAELVKVLIPSFRRWDVGEKRATQNWAIIAAALVIAMLQSIGYSRSLEALQTLVPEPGAVFRLTCMATMVAATAVFAWLADQITRHGVGSGFWILLVAPAVADVCPAIVRGALLHDQGELPGAGILVYAGFVVASVAGVVALEWTRFRSGKMTTSLCLWPTVLGFMAFYWTLQLLLVTGGRDAFPLYEFLFASGRPLNLLALAAFIAAFTVLYHRSLARLPDAAAPANGPSASIVALALIAIALAGELILTHLQVPLPFDGRNIVITTVVALSILAAARAPT